jgi:hypothetical protein
LGRLSSLLVRRTFHSGVPKGDSKVARTSRQECLLYITLAPFETLLLNESVLPSDAAKKPTRNPWLWIPTLYLAEGLPYVVVMTVSVIMYKGFHVTNTQIALYTSSLYLPWVI